MNEIEEKRQELIDILDDICKHAIDMDEREMKLFYDGYDYALRTKLIRCKNCRFFLPVCIPQFYADTDPKSVFCQDSLSTKVCAKGHNGYETFGCTEGEYLDVENEIKENTKINKGEPKNVQD